MKKRIKDIFILHDFIEKDKLPTKKYSKKVYTYLNSCPIIGLEGLGTNAARTDGVWTWSDSIAEPYKDGEICLPEKFITHVNAHFFPYPFWFGFKIHILRLNLVDEINILIEEKIQERQNNI